MLRESSEKGEGCERRGGGVPGSWPLAFFAVRVCTVAVVPSLPTCAHWRVRSFSPLSPGGKGTREGEQREEGRGARAPPGPPTVALRVRRARASRHPSPLFSALLRAPPGRRGCSPHSCGGAWVLRTSPRAGIPEPLTAAAGAQQQRRRQGPHLRAAGGSPPQVSGAAAASAAFKGTTSSSAAAVTGRSGRPGWPGVRARACSPAPRPLPRPASRARALRPAWPPLLVDVTPASHPALGRLRRRAPRTSLDPGGAGCTLCSKACLSSSLPASRPGPA